MVKIISFITNKTGQSTSKLIQIQEWKWKDIIFKRPIDQLLVAKEDGTTCRLQING